MQTVRSPMAFSAGNKSGQLFWKKKSIAVLKLTIKSYSWSQEISSDTLFLLILNATVAKQRRTCGKCLKISLQSWLEVILNNLSLFAMQNATKSKKNFTNFIDLWWIQLTVGCFLFKMNEGIVLWSASAAEVKRYHQTSFATSFLGATMFTLWFRA